MKEKVVVITGASKRIGGKPLGVVPMFADTTLRRTR